MSLNGRALVLLLAALASCSAPPPLIQPRPGSPAAPPLRETATPLSQTLPQASTIRERAEAVQSDRLIASLAALVGAGSRHALSPLNDLDRGIHAARLALVGEFNRLRAARPDIQVWTQAVPLALGGYQSVTENVVCIIPGTALDAGVVVIGAHYDTLLNLDFFNTRSPAPGANANGSGVAVLLESARIMAAAPHRATLIFIAFTASETGRQGSAAFIKSYLQAQTPPIVPRAMLNLDTLGANRKANGENGPAALRLFSADPNDSRSRQLARGLQLAMRAYPELLAFDMQSAAERTGHSGDHQTFAAAGSAAVSLIEPFEDATRAHSARDTLDAIRPEYLISATQAVLAALSGLADGLEPPAGVVLSKDVQPPTLLWQPVRGAASYILALRQTTSLTFDQYFIVGGSPFGWGGLSRYAIGALATVSPDGIIGPFAPEFALS